MANQPTLLGNRISLKNGIGADATPYRFVEIDTTVNQFIKPSANGGIIGVLEPNRSFEDYETEDGEDGSVQIDGIADVDLGGTVTVGDYVKADSVGRAVSGGALSTISCGATPISICGRALESGVSGGRIAVVIQPQIIAATAA